MDEDLISGGSGLIRLKRKIINSMISMYNWFAKKFVHAELS